MIKKQKIWSFILSLALVLSLTVTFSFIGCKEAAPAEEAVEEVAEEVEEIAEEAVEEVAEEVELPLVGFGLYFRQDQWWMDLEAAALRTAEEVGVKLNIQDADGDPIKCVTNIENFLAMGVDAIIYSPVDAESTIEVVKEARSRDIPVVTIESTIATFPENVDCWVRLDQKLGAREMARLAGEFLDENYGGKGKVLLLHDYSNTIVIERIDAFKEGLQEYAPDAEIVAELDGACDRSQGITLTENTLTSHPDLAVVFAGNTEMGMGAHLAFDAKGVDSSKVAVYTEAWGVEFYDALMDENNYMKGYMIGPSVPIGEISVQVVGDYLNKGIPFNQIENVVMDIITKENVDQYMSYFQ